MPYIMNTLNEKVSTQAHGKWFSWAPGEIKSLHNVHLVEFLAQKRGEDGLVEIPESTMELDKNGSEYKVAISEKRKEGIAKRVAKLNSVIRNLEMSLRRDYETSGQKGNYNFEASIGELNAYKELAKYREFEQAEKLNVADEIQKARAALYGETETRPSPLEPAKS